ncbi:PALP-domain-containing protein [Cylindrobasidium torrendii FP15055 ss-10]|uniref:cysteine synthase n=1 Tax=Cylindrobasidium torrendii FP15055 ss-10 TaxID=1314674 RepID=A0A0D7B606_9AGAR|nr:PALP-domain-containing protein [Cylindrobasidium torrendii FP15055 ss-10]
MNANVATVVAVLQDWLPQWLRTPARPTLRHLLYGIVLGFSLSITSTSLALAFERRKRERINHNFEARPIELRRDEILSGVTGLIGNTPLVRINSLSDALGVEILGKAEFLNPGGSVKDRVALRMIEDAERQGLIHPHTGSRIFEGTSGSTGISIATIARARGYEATIIMQDDVSQDKVNALLSLGATVERVRPASIVDKGQFVNVARQRAMDFGRTHAEAPTDRPNVLSSTPSTLVVSTSADDGEASPSDNTDFIQRPRGFFADQFENRSNFEAHFDGTGPEIWRQTNGDVKAFVSGAGTGGTIAGVGRFLKSMEDDISIVLADPEGSGLYNKVKFDVMYSNVDSEGKKRRHQVDTIVEGIGLNRLTRNIELGLPMVDTAYQVSDAEAVAMSRYLVKHDGLFLGSSSACNLVACIKFIKEMGWNSGEKVVTILCDSGSRHYSKFWNDEFLEKAGIPVDLSILDALLSSS